MDGGLNNLQVYVLGVGLALKRVVAQFEFSQPVKSA